LGVVCAKRGDRQATVPGFHKRPDRVSAGGKTKDELRAASAAAARDLARRTGLSHAQVNAQLNRQVGLRRVTELEMRLNQAEGWLNKA